MAKGSPNNVSIQLKIKSITQRGNDGKKRKLLDGTLLVVISDIGIYVLVIFGFYKKCIPSTIHIVEAQNEF